MIINPHAGTPTESGWTMGFAFGYMGPNFEVPTPSVIAPELAGAFNEGRLVGQQSAIEGLSLTSECMDVSQDVSPAGEEFVTGIHVIEVIDALNELRTHLSHGLVSIAVLLFELSIPGPPPVSPEELLPTLGARFVATLGAMGIADGDLFIAVGVDMETAGCEFRFSPLFKSLDQARQAADAMGRPHRVIARWRLNASGSFELIEAR
jgi:hypothetical protein